MASRDSHGRSKILTLLTLLTMFPLYDTQIEEEPSGGKREEVPSAASAASADFSHASSNDMVSQENCGHGINGARSANTCAALMKHRARRVAPRRTR